MPPVARKDDSVIGLDMHVEMVPTPGGQVPTPLPHTFSGPLNGGLATTVKADDQPVAVVGSTADNSPAHIPSAGSFQSSPKNKATVVDGSGTVFANDKKVARVGDPADSCDDLGGSRNAHIASGSGTVIAD